MPDFPSPRLPPPRASQEPLTPQQEADLAASLANLHRSHMALARALMLRALDPIADITPQLAAQLLRQLPTRGPITVAADPRLTDSQAQLVIDALGAPASDLSGLLYDIRRDVCCATGRWPRWTISEGAADAALVHPHFHAAVGLCTSNPTTRYLPILFMGVVEVALESGYTAVLGD